MLLDTELARNPYLMFWPRKLRRRMAAAARRKPRILTPFLSAAEGVALGKFDSRKCRDELAPGPYPIDYRVRVSGNLLITADYHQLFVTLGDVQRLLAHALARLARHGVSLEGLVDTAFPDAESFRVEDEKAADLAVQLRPLIEARKPKTLCKGRVTADLKFTRD